MRQNFLRSQRTQSLQNMKGKDRCKGKNSGEKIFLIFNFLKMSDGKKDRRTQIN